MTTGARARLVRLAAGGGRRADLRRGAGRLRRQCGRPGEGLVRPRQHLTRTVVEGEAHDGPDDGRVAAREAYIQLLDAIPIAAQAAYHDIQWEALSATLSEANRVPEAELVPSLQTQCSAADNSVFNQPPPPSSSAGG